MPDARFHPGNGAALCRFCHNEAHFGFNGKPDLTLPVDSEGGEKLESVAELFRLLAQQFYARHRDYPEYYYLDEVLLARFKRMQGFDEVLPMAGAPIEQAWWIWDCAPLQMTRAVIRANLQ